MNDRALAKRDVALAPQQQRYLTIKDLLDSPVGQQKLAEYARNVDPMQLVRVAKFMAAKNETLGKATPMSVLNALVDCARLGLEPGGRAGGAYLVPYWNPKANGNRGGFEAQMQTDYRGEIMLVRRGGIVLDVWPAVVREKDTFYEVRGAKPDLVHKIDHSQPRGGIIAAYAVLTLKGDITKWRVLSKADIDDRRNRSSGWQAYQKGKTKSSIWNDHEEAMCLKTAIRAACSLEPVEVVGRDYAKWAEHEDARDRDEEPEIPLEGDEPEPPESKTESLSEELRYEMEAERAFETDNPTQT